MGTGFYQLGAILSVYNDAWAAVFEAIEQLYSIINNNKKKRRRIGPFHCISCFVLFVCFSYSAKNEFRASCVLGKNSTASIQSHNVLLKSKDYVCWGFVSPRFHNTVPFDRHPKCDSHDRTRGHPKSYTPESDTSVCTVSLPPQGEDPVYPD